MAILKKYKISDTDTAICQYQIWCPEHGYKSANWSIDPPQTTKWIKNSFRRMYDEVSFPTHIGCGTITIIDERVQSGLS